MSRRKKNQNSKIILLLIILVILTFLVPIMKSLSKYVYNAIHDYYLGTKGFYFNSDKLSNTYAEFEIANNWSGAETYSITINLNSKKNDLVFAESDIYYNITVTGSDNIDCNISKTTGVIKGSASGGINEDYFIVTINPKNGTALKNGETTWVEVTATSTSPYAETLSGKLYVGVGTKDISYEIIDSANNPYLEVNITNSLDTSKDITLTFDPNVVLLDMTSEFRLKSKSITTELISNYNYVNTVTSSLGSLETTTVKFYKVDPSKDYTHQSGDTGDAVIQLTY